MLFDTGDFSFLPSFDNSSSAASGTDTTLSKNIVIKINQRNARKSITIVEGLDRYVTLDTKYLSIIKKEFNTNGNIVEDQKHGMILQLQGDHKKKMRKFLLDKNICDKDLIIIRGF